MAERDTDEVVDEATEKLELAQQEIEDAIETLYGSGNLYPDEQFAASGAADYIGAVIEGIERRQEAGSEYNQPDEYDDLISDPTSPSE